MNFAACANRSNKPCGDGADRSLQMRPYRRRQLAAQGQNPWHSTHLPPERFRFEMHRRTRLSPFAISENLKFRWSSSNSPLVMLMFQLPCQTTFPKIAVIFTRLSPVFVPFSWHTFVFGEHPSLDSPKIV